MREEAAFLEDIAEAAPLGRQVDALRAREQGLAADRDAAAIGPQQPRQHVDEAGLAGAGAAEQRGDAGIGRGEARLDLKRAEALLDLDFDHASPCRRRPRRRAMSSETTSAAMAITTEITASRHAAASPPGTCVNA